MQISCGAFHTMILTNAGLFTCGLNQSGQLGHDEPSESSTLKNITKEFGEFNIKQIACGSHFSVVLTHSNRIYTFGNNSNRQLGNETSSNSHKPIDVTPFLKRAAVAQDPAKLKSAVNSCQTDAQV